MKSYAKAEALLRDVAEKLAKRYAGSSTIDTVRSARDSAGWPIIFCSDGGVETAGSSVIAIRIKAVDAISKDVFGNSLTAFAPHDLEIAYELNSTDSQPSHADVLKAEFEAIKVGAKVKLLEIADGTAVTAAAMDAATPVLEIEELYWPNKSV